MNAPKSKIKLFGNQEVRTEWDENAEKWWFSVVDISQARIVTILEKFDALVDDLSIGLPAEIMARRQQYEHYRDRLLTFGEAA